MLVVFQVRRKGWMGVFERIVEAENVVGESVLFIRNMQLPRSRSDHYEFVRDVRCVVVDVGYSEVR